MLLVHILDADDGTAQGLDCKKLKIRCEVFPGDKKCKHCLRRNVSCIIKRSYGADVDTEEDFLRPADVYE